MKIKMKFKPAYPNGPRDDNDVIVLKVKRKDWREFSRLLGAGRQNASDYAVDKDAAIKIENKFDLLRAEHD